MIYAILGIVILALGGGIWWWFQPFSAGQNKEQVDTLKAGSQARERQDESFDSDRGGLAERIGIRLRDHNRRKT
jgi:hypothetical protein